MNEPVPYDGSHLTMAQAAYIEDYMVKVLQILNLPHWRIKVGQDLPPEGTDAMVLIPDGRRMAILMLNKLWWSQADELKLEDLAHEALHLVHNEVSTLVRRFIEDSSELSHYLKSVMLDHFNQNLELMVDTLSYAVVQWLPAWDPTEEAKNEA